MHDLIRFSLKDMVECGSALRNMSADAESMEETADRIVRYLYDHLIDHGTGEKACTLVRFFKTHPYGELNSELRKCVREMPAGHAESATMKCLTLLASAGERKEWNSRHTSAGHKVIPLVSEQMVAKFPMISNLINQLGLEVSTVLNPDPSLLVDLSQTSYNVFHVLEAVESPFVPAQEDFVIPFEVRSALGFGGMLPSGNLFAIILFSKVQILKNTADIFKTLALNVRMAVLPFDGRAVFASHDKQPSV